MDPIEPHRFFVRLMTYIDMEVQTSLHPFLLLILDYNYIFIKIGQKTVDPHQAWLEGPCNTCNTCCSRKVENNQMPHLISHSHMENVILFGILFATNWLPDRELSCSELVPFSPFPEGLTNAI